MIKLPTVDNQRYEVSDQKWQEITNEIIDLKQRIEAKEDLQPNDVKQVRSLVRSVRSYSQDYRKAITKQATVYKQKIDEKLQALGYDAIEQYIDQKRREEQQQLDDRLNQKLTKFNALIDEAVAKTDHLKQSALATFVNTNLSSRFPNVNSGAKSKVIKDWGPIAAVINVTLQNVEQKMVEMPALNQLPISAPLIQTLGQYMKTGDLALLQNLKPTALDYQFEQQLTLRKTITSAPIAIHEMKNVLADASIDVDTQMQRITMLLDAYRANRI